MCEVCGCGDVTKVSIDVHRSLLADNDHEAAHLREHFAAHGVAVVNLMGSPGSGKTALLEATARAMKGSALAAVSGDLATELDAQRLAAAGIHSRAITTGNACHLDAKMVHRALHDEALSRAVHDADYFFIENVGNLVCPAIYDLGQRANVVALSVTEGVDKPLKYPVMFHHADLVVVTKVDLLPYLGGSVTLEALRANVERTKPGLPVLAVSATTGAGVSDWVAWLAHIATHLPEPTHHHHEH